MVITDNMMLCCHIFEEQAKDIVKTPHYSRSTEPIGFLQALKSQRNTEGSELQNLVQKGWGIGDGVIDTSDPNSKPRFKIKSYMSTCTDVAPERLHACTTTEEFEDDKESYEFIPEIINSVQMAFNKRQMSELCGESPNDYQTRRLMKKAMSLLEKENRDLLALAIPQMGDYEACGEKVDSLESPLTLNLLSCDYQTLSPTVEPLMQQAYQSIGFNESPIMVGGNIAGFADKLNQRIVGANMDGVDTRMRSSIHYDKNVDAIFGDSQSHLLSWSPTMLQSAEWFRHVGVQTDELDTMIRRTISLPLFGRNWLFDYSITYVPCDEEFIVTLTRQTGLFCIPNNSDCLIGDGKLHFLLGCGSFSCEDLQTLISCPPPEEAPAA